ncbi:aspartate--ammonia ligase [Candidatus Micrarchaeota archaeon]|nr:aspartate--ammonia ligase [Candidatus Micrarchaeota archaeon]
MTKPASPAYAPILDVRKTEMAIPFIKKTFQGRLEESLNLWRVSAQMFVPKGTGINDDLNGTERKVTFPAAGIPGAEMEVVNSLAKWKRMKLAEYGFRHGEGLWTDMNAIRPDEVLDSIHSLYVDQWDWERVMSAEERNMGFLKMIVGQIYDAVLRTERCVSDRFDIAPILPAEIQFITTAELEERHPSLSRKDRESAIAREAGAAFISQIGWPLKDGKPHDGRAPDYDDWNLNGDIIVWNPVLQSAFELSSMGIRVDRESLLAQLKEAGAMDRLGLKFHAMLMDGKLPLSIGGGIGQSRLSMFLLRKAHIGEVQASEWPDEIRAECERIGVRLL